MAKARGIFKATKEESVIILKIARRIAGMAAEHGSAYSLLDAQMDIDACHSKGCRLKLKELLAADDFNFAHDAFGIRYNMTREGRNIGKLRNCFVPRFADTGRKKFSYPAEMDATKETPDA